MIDPAWLYRIGRERGNRAAEICRDVKGAGEKAQKEKVRRMMAELEFTEDDAWTWIEHVMGQPGRDGEMGVA